MINTLLTLREAARLTSMSTCSLRLSIKAGELRTVRRTPRGRHKVERAELQRWWTSLGGGTLDLSHIDEETPR